MSNDVAESINQQLIAGRFGHVGLRQLRTNLYADLYAADEGLRGRNVLQSVVD